MSALVFVQPETESERAKRWAAIEERVRELLAEIEQSGATRGEVRLSPSEAPPFGGTLAIDLDPKPQPPANDRGCVTQTFGGEQ